MSMHYKDNAVAKKEVFNLMCDHLVSTGPHNERENLFSSNILDRIIRVKGKDYGGQYAAG